MHLIELAASSDNYLDASDFIVQVADCIFSIIYLLLFSWLQPVFCLSRGFLLDKIRIHRFATRNSHMCIILSILLIVYSLLYLFLHCSQMKTAVILVRMFAKPIERKVGR